MDAALAVGPATAATMGADLTTPKRSCQTCESSGLFTHLDNVPTQCWDCSSSMAHGGPHLPNWTPITMERRIQATPPAAPTESPEKAVDKQVGGGHYKDCGIQPIEYIHANGLNFFEGSAVKYITRWRQKGGVQDLRKAIHFLELQIELDGLK